MSNTLTVICAATFHFGTVQLLHAQQSGSGDVPVIEAPASENSVGAENEDNSKAGERELVTLDNLFEDLKKQTKARAARRISKQIWAIWADSGSDSINLLMERAGTAMQDNKNALALDILDQVVALKPDYAEGWNRRATLYFNMQDFGRSISDIEQVLALEPRHFGALSGLGLMLSRIGREEEALETWYKVLEIYPANASAQKQVIDLVEKLSGSKT